jgi:hypothetical protein
VIYQSGASGWSDSVPWSEKVQAPEAGLSFGAAVVRRERTSPSARKGLASGLAFGGAGREFGTAAHALFEQIGWVNDDEEISLPDGADAVATRAVRETLAVPAVRALFVRRGGAELFREQGFEVLVEGRWMSGVADRLHVWRDEAGMVARCEVIDFKTDAVEAVEDLAERYGEQIEDYRRSMAALFNLDLAAVRCLVVSTHLPGLLEIRPAG